MIVYKCDVFRHLVGHYKRVAMELIRGGIPQERNRGRLLSWE